jgi:SNF2 family DNA or RNA helicase
MTITEDKENLIIEFGYNPSIINIVSRIDGRKYNSKRKNWIIPKLQILKTIDSLKNFDFEISENILKEYQFAKKRKEKINKLKKGIFNEKENEIFEKLNLPLFEFQKIGIAFVCATGSCLLCDEPGLGKTLQALTVTRIKNSKKVLIVCPATLKLSWKEEIEKWFPDFVVNIIEGTKEKRTEKWNKESNYYLMNYEQLLKDIEEIKKIKWDYIIADEATRISNNTTKQTELIKTIYSKNKIAMTGTPLNNAIEDIWSLVDFCQPKLLGKYYSFVDKYCTKDNFKIKYVDKETGRTKERKISKISGYKNITELKEILNDVMLRRRKEEVLHELPDKLYENIYIDFSKEEKNIYKTVKERIIEELKEYQLDRVLNDSINNIALTKILRLSQVADSLKILSNIDFSSKTNALKELLKDILHDNSKAIIFTRFSEMANILIKELKEYCPLLISGDVDNETRQENVSKLRNIDEHKIIIMTEAGSMGLNLQRANYVIHYDLPWSISKLKQREDRAHRIGQQKNVTIFKLIVKDTIDEHVLKVLNKKESLAEKVLSDNDKIKKYKINRYVINKILS